jgi:hypothetical protein
MDLPQVKRRISDFIAGEEGKISKQSLLTMGAFIGSASAAALLVAPAAHGQEHASGPETPPPPPPPTCPGNPDMDIEVNCPPQANEIDAEPGEGCPVDKDALTGHNAYEKDGTQKFFGNGKCSDDDKPFHFNGSDFSYTNNVLTAQHHHHGSHNSY